MRRIFSLYWHALSGFRWKAGWGVLLIAASGLLEGTALLVLAPILGRGISLARQKPFTTYDVIYARLHVPLNYRLTYTFSAFIVIGIASALVHVVADAVMIRLHTQIEQSFRTRMGDALFKMSWPQLIALGVGDVGKAIFTEGLHAGDGCFSFIQMIGFLMVTFIFTVISLLVSTPLTLVTFAFGALASVAYLWGGRRASNHARILADKATLIGQRISEIFQSLKFIRATGNTRQAREETTVLYAEYAMSNFKSQIYRSIIRCFYESSGILVIAGFLAYGFFWSGKPMEWTIIFLAVFYRLSPRIQLVQDGFYAARIHAPWVIDWQKRFDRITSHADRQQSHEVVRASESVEIQGASYQYPQSDVRALRDIDLRLAQGRCIALVGESGSGKSTVLDLVTGLLQPATGKVLIDGVALTQMDLESWRLQIGLVQQGSPLFYGTILKNIAWGDAHPDTHQAIACAKMANAWEFIRRLPQGIETQVEEKGGRFSGGQRQRIALARALYRNPWLLILDEPTSELDSESEDHILKALLTIKGRYTMLITSHRLKMARLADEILVLEQGRIIQRGDWASLSSDSAGLFRRLAEQQSLG